MNAKILFTSAALFNWGGVLVLMPALGIPAMLGLAPLPVAGVFTDIALAAIGLFGVGYWMVSRAPERQRGLIVLGLTSKLTVAAIVFAHYAAGSANLNLAALIMGDVVYAALFWRYLAKTRA